MEEVLLEQIKDKKVSEFFFFLKILGDPNMTELTLRALLSGHINKDNKLFNQSGILKDSKGNDYQVLPNFRGHAVNKEQEEILIELWKQNQTAQGQNLGIPLPPRSWLKHKHVDTVEHVMAAPQVVFLLDETVSPGTDHVGFLAPETGGIFRYFKGFKYPAKGFPNPHAAQANNIAKRTLITQLKYFAKNPLAAITLLRKKNLQVWLWEYATFAKIPLGQHFLEDNKYSAPCRELRKFMDVFLKEYGISPGIEDRFDVPETFAFLLEFDDAYLNVLQDLANETSAEMLSKHPVKELYRLYEILNERSSRKGVKEKFGAILYLFSFLFLLPGVKRAWRKALKVIDWKQVQMTEADRHHMLLWDNYNYFGESFEVRKQKFIDIYGGNLPPAKVIQTQV